jgi:hypothetical protein
MVNVGLSPGSILGILVAVAGAALYFLRSMRPELARDHDIFFAAIGLLCGGILFFQGWRLDPILLFGQILLTGSSIFFAAESIRLRGVATDQARRSTPIVDEDRPPSRVYRAELDELSPTEDIPRRIRSSRDGASRSRTAYVDELEGEVPSSRRPSSRRPSSGGNRPTADRPARRRPPRPDSGAVDSAAPQDLPYERRHRSTSRPPNQNSETASKPPRRRPRPEPPVDTSSSADYVDYQPMDYTDYSDHESDNSANFDDDE